MPRIRETHAERDAKIEELLFAVELHGAKALDEPENTQLIINIYKRDKGAFDDLLYKLETKDIDRDHVIEIAEQRIIRLSAPKYVSVDGFIMNAKGLTAKVLKKSGKIQTIEDVYISGPFEIIGRVRDPKDDGWARLLRWQDEDKRTHIIPVSDAGVHATPNILCASLASQGLRITISNYRQKLLEYLNGSEIKDRVTIVSRTGWHTIKDTKTFVLPNITIGEPDGEHVILLGSSISPYSASGTLDDWKDTVGKAAEGQHRVIFGICIAFVGPVLNLVDAEAGGFNLYGPSSIGKTTIEKAAASVWARGDDKSFIRSWHATGNGLEGAATIHSDTFIAPDELGRAPVKEVGGVVYALAGGVGKQRAQKDGSAKPLNTWRVFVLSTGELKIVDKIREGGARAKAGQEMRILDVNADAGIGLGVFDRAPDNDPRALVEKMCADAATFYGTAGPAFVKGLLEDGVEGAVQTIRSIQTAMRQKADIGNNATQVCRALDRFALVAAAGELAISYGVVPWQAGAAIEAAFRCFQSWRAARGGDDPAEIRNAIEAIKLILERYGDARFQRLDDADAKPPTERLGYVRGSGADREWLIPSETWTTVFCLGADAPSVAAELVRRGLLLPDKENRSSQTVWIEGGSQRAYVLPAKAWFADTTPDTTNKA